MAVGYSSAKLTLHVGDGFEFMKQNQEAFDVIITDSSDPMGKNSSHKRALLSTHLLHIFLFCLPLGSSASLLRILSSEKTVADLETIKLYQQAFKPAVTFLSSKFSSCNYFFWQNCSLSAAIPCWKGSFAHVPADKAVAHTDGAAPTLKIAGVRLLYFWRGKLS